MDYLRFQKESMRTIFRIKQLKIIHNLSCMLCQDIVSYMDSMLHLYLITDELCP
jgi:hypothetical protein